MIAEDFISSAKNYLVSLFLKEQAESYAAFEARVHKEEEVANGYRTMKGWIESKKVDLAYLEEKLALYGTFEPEATIFNALKANGVSQISKIANELSSALILKQYLPAIVNLAKADLALCEKSFQDFRSRNSKIVKQFESARTKEAEDLEAARVGAIAQPFAT